jgi:hypothetical protein
MSARIRPYLFVVALVCGLAASSSSASAVAVAPGTGWAVAASVFPTNLPPGGEGDIQIDIDNTGAAPSEGPITVTDTLAPGLTVTNAGGLRGRGVRPLSPEEEKEAFEGEVRWECTGNGTGERGFEDASAITCTSNPTSLPHIPAFAHPPFEFTEIVGRLGIAVTATGSASGTNRVTVAGGGALAATSVSDPVTISSAEPAFGFTGWDWSLTNADGTPDTQAGSHPYEATVFFGLNEQADPLPGSTDNARVAGGEVRNLEVSLPPGFFGDPRAVPRCTRGQLDGGGCPAATQIGTSLIGLASESGGGTTSFFLDAVYNMVPPPGVPAEFAQSFAGFNVFLDAGVRPGGGYGLVEHVDNIPANVNFDENILTLWGVPQEASHDAQRQKVLVCGETENGCASGSPPKPFLTLPTSCAGPQPFTIRALGTWQDPEARAEATTFPHDDSGAATGFTGCEGLSIEPSLSLLPESSFADTASGLTADLKVPQETLTVPHGLVASTIKNTKVTLPPGLVVNPGRAAGLAACQPAEANIQSEGPASCPAASKIGTVKIKTPLLEEDLESELEGGVYVLQSNPPNLEVLVTASGDGVFIKIVGHVHLDEATGRLVTTFTETPELPFTDFRLSFEGGAQAAFATPSACGAYETTSDFTPWATPFGEDVLSPSSFLITDGPADSACASPLPFAPSMVAGSTSDQAGAFTNFSLALQRGDGQQRIGKLQFKEPAGLAALISQVPLCGEPQAAQGTCSAASHIGHSLVTSGPGASPLAIPQPGAPEAPIYLTGPYEGAPFGLSIVTPVIAGPFNLGTIVVRAKIEVDPNTAQVTITTDPLPQIIDGVPTDLRSIESIIDRPGFIFNPTDCAAQEFTGTATSAQGATAPISSRFQIGGCQSLKFAPDIKVSTAGKTSKANGASLFVKIAQKPGEANIHKVDLQLPIALPSRLTTLQKACTEAQFNANPAGCPEASNIGTAVAHTPVLTAPLTGPAYLVSHGGAAFPDVEFILQGEGITIELDGKTDIKKGVTFSRFETVPDAPISSFETSLPEGPHSVLAANRNLCALTKTVTVTKHVTRRVHGRVLHSTKKVKQSVAQPLLMPTMITGQNGAQLTQTTKIAVTGCAKVEAKKVVKKKAAGKKKRGK